ncbi:MAG: Zn-dependent alcohol dehydrogenase [Dehalococcoidales bacterium]|nr:Zn-dependent alcohol dehydrogenase [Dehalococcoidales bacterium]
MKAAVCYEYGKPLSLEDVDIDPPREGEVKVKVVATAVCHSDIHCITGEMPGRIPGVPGHESAGYVAEAGKGVTYVKEGDAVLLSTTPWGCGECYYCSIGYRHLCQNAPMVPPHQKNKKGEYLAPMAGPVGGFAEYTVVSDQQLVKVPDDMPLDKAALLSCGVLTGYGAVVNRANIKTLDSALVMGTGGVGLNAIQTAALSGAYPVIAVDILDSKLELAKQFGATHTVNSKAVEDPIQAVKDITHGRGADNVFVTVGNAAALKQGFNMCAPRGTTIVIGLVPVKEPINFMVFDFLGGERNITGCGGGSTRLRIDIPRIIELYKDGLLKVDELISGYYPFDKINEAIESTMQGNVIRNIVMIQE